MSVTPYLLFTTAAGQLLNSDAPQPDPVRFDSVPFPGRPPLSSAAAPFFPITSWSCGTVAALRTSSPTITTGKAQFSPLSVSRTVDRATPTIFADLCAGTTLKYVDLVMLNNFPGDDWPNELHEAVGLGTVFVESLEWRGSNGTDAVAEDAGFDYGQIWVGYATLDQYGEARKFVTKGWDRTTNTPL